MKKLIKTTILLSILTSCGRVSIPLFEKHSDDDDGNTNASSYPTVQIESQRPYVCSSQAIQSNCTTRLRHPIVEVLPPRAFFSHYCHEQYLMCLKGRY